MSMNVDTERLIELVKSHPTLWDKTLKAYNIKIAREHVWREICSQLTESYDKMDKTQKYAYEKLFVKKWNQLRDSWVRDIKKRYRIENRLPYTTTKRYKYYKELLFLKKVINLHTRLTGIKTEQEDEDDDQEEITFEEHLDITDDSNDGTTMVVSEDFEIKRKSLSESRASDNMDPIMTYSNEIPIEEAVVPTYRHDVNDSHLHFFKGLLPITATLNVDETLEFQSGVISLLQKIKKQRQGHFRDSETS